MLYTERLIGGRPLERGSRGAEAAPHPPKSQGARVRLAMFSFTPEDFRYVEKAAYQVILTLGTGVNKSRTIRLAMRVFASMSVEELRALLHRLSGVADTRMARAAGNEFLGPVM